MCGWSFSGKSYLANLISQKTSAEIISLDKINEERGLDNNSEIPVLEWENTNRIAQEQLDDFLSQGKSVIIDDTNPLIMLRERYSKIAASKNVETVVVYVEIPKDEIDKRIKAVEGKGFRHIAPLVARENLFKMFEIPDPQREHVLVYRFGDDIEEWIQSNF
jgi:predicted kinase